MLAQNKRPMGQIAHLKKKTPFFAFHLDFRYETRIKYNKTRNNSDKFKSFIQYIKTMY